MQRKEEFARDATREMGKVLAETRGDVQEAIDMTYYMAGEGRRQFGQTTPSEMAAKFQMSVRMPVGVAGLITPWNFPMAIPSWKMMPALILGNTVVIKPAPDTPLSTVNLIKALEEAGLPQGVVNMVTGGGPEVGRTAHDPQGRGRSCPSPARPPPAARSPRPARPTFKHCHLEMGGKNVIMVMDDADLDLAVDGAVWGGFGTTGQRCTAASRVVLHEKVYSEFTKRFVARVESPEGGQRPRREHADGPCHQPAAAREDRELRQDRARTRERSSSRAGSRLAKGDHARGFFHEPTVFGDCDPTMRIAREEIFGPVVSLIPVGSLDEAIEVGNSVDYGLSASIYTRDINKAFRGHARHVHRASST